MNEVFWNLVVILLTISVLCVALIWILCANDVKTHQGNMRLPKELEMELLDVDAGKIN